MNHFDKFALGAVILTTLLCARETLAIGSFYIDFLDLPPSAAATGVAGWLVATYGPIAVAALCWRWAKRVRFPWVPHLLLLPAAVIVFRTGASLLLSVIRQPDFDAMIGAPVFPAILLFVIAIGGYFAAVVATEIGTAGDHN